MLFRLLSCARLREQVTELEFRAGTSAPRAARNDEFERRYRCGNPMRPFSERSARMLYMALKDVKTAMNHKELKMLRLCHQLPLKAVEVSKGTNEVKDLMVQTDVELKTAKI